MWLNVTAEATSRADIAAAAITSQAAYYQTLVQSRKLAASFVADPASISSAGIFELRVKIVVAAVKCA
jgi:hypothetical protein